MRGLICLLLLVASVVALSANVSAFGQEGCGAGECRNCHEMTLEEAKTMFSKADKVNSVDFAEIPGMFVVEIEDKGQKIPLYVDFSKKYLVLGNVFRLEDGSNIAEPARAEAKPEPPAPPKRLTFAELARLPLDDALLLGKADARWKIIVFTDPDCSWCKKLHAEMRQVVAENPQIAFLLKLFPLPMHENAYPKSKSIVCAGSVEMLEASFAGQSLPPAGCETDVVDQTIALAAALEIKGTPALILPDGRIVPGYLPAQAMVQLIDEMAADAEKPKE